jgi:hypothetical protein
MHVFGRLMTTVLFLAMISVNGMLGDEPAKVLTLPVARAVVVDEGVAGADVVEVNLEENAKDGPAEKLNLEVLTAPLQALFGFAVGGDMAVPANMAAQNDAMAMQFQQQFRPFLTEELNFVRLVCSDLSKEQRPKIKIAGEASLKLASKQMAEAQNRQNQVRILGNKPVEVPEPRKMIREAIAGALQETLTEEQTVRYKHEAADRTALRKQAAILSVVSRLDGCLFLNEVQRTKIVTEISSNWQEKWEQWLMMSSYSPDYFPVLPDQYITTHLNADQKSVYQSLQKIDFGIWWGGGIQVQQNDGWWGDEPGNAEAGLNGVIINFQAIGF